MRAVRASGACVAPFTECVQVATEGVPTPRHGEALIRMNASSINPSDVDTVEAGGCARGCGADISGVVVSCAGCTRLREGDQVWGLTSPACNRPPALAPTRGTTETADSRRCGPLPDE